MPDQSDVEVSLAGFLADTLYPYGVGQPSILGTVFRVFPGWPVAAALEADLAQGVAQISVLAMPGHVRDTTRYSSDMISYDLIHPTLMASVIERVVTISGLAGLGQVAGVLVDGRSYAYRLRPGDDAGAVAAALAELVRADRPAVLQGTSIVLAGGGAIAARVVADGSGLAELRRQVMAFRVSIWAPAVSVRDEVAAVLDSALAASTFLDVTGWACRVRPGVGAVSDQGSAAGIWRRDLGVSVEFPTAVTTPLPAMMFGVDVVNSVSLTV